MAQRQTELRMARATNLQIDPNIRDRRKTRTRRRSAPGDGDLLAGDTVASSSSSMSCASWRLGVEANNIRDWYSIPAECRGYVSNYMFGNQFLAVAYAEGLELADDGRDVWSRLTNYADTGFGRRECLPDECREEPYNATYLDEYVADATAPPLPEVLEVVFITGRHDYKGEVTIKNLRSAGYHTWEKLMLKCVHTPLPLAQTGRDALQGSFVIQTTKPSCTLLKAQTVPMSSLVAWADYLTSPSSSLDETDVVFINMHCACTMRVARDSVWYL
ncbi:hypothetical protein HU200_020672 [Digitaria exilis]|uniref:Uncharacterized protein n=1 Tax=Digitaria exilis TaxID=1010633 RepID=A0A835F0W8_9POAL|nr:hypothetical protein HU200_020672 [Digitaria exilis]